MYTRDFATADLDKVWELHREALVAQLRDYLRALPERLPGWPLAMEFRGGGWMEPDSAAATLRRLEEAGLAYVAVDLGMRSARRMARKLGVERRPPQAELPFE